MLRIAKTTGILLTALLLEFYLFVFFFSYFENSYVTLNYFWQTIVFGFMYVIAFVAYISAPASCYIYASCLLFYFKSLFRQLTERNLRQYDSV